MHWSKPLPSALSLDENQKRVQGGVKSVGNRKYVPVSPVPVVPVPVIR